MNYSDKVMRNELDSCTDQELQSVLITSDGRGPKNKQKSLQILLDRAIEKAYRDGQNNILDHVKRCSQCKGEGVDGFGEEWRANLK